MVSSPADRPFLSIIAWPPEFGREDLAALLFETAGLDEADLRLRLGHEAPMAIGQVEPEAARLAIEAIEASGGDAFAPTLGELAALGASHKIRRLTIEGDLHADLWTGMSARIRRESIALLVRGTVRREQREEGPQPPVGSMLAEQNVMEALEEGPVPIVMRRVQASERIDIHTRDGTIFQVDGDAFDFGVLGDLRGHGDKVNADRLVELLRHVAPRDVIVDEFFRLWRPPPGHQRLRLPRPARGREDPAFAFYSRWVALMYRHLASG